ncbi:MAG: glycosyl hydrolase 108 family protein [Acetobacteraceae bacterium]
MQQDQPSATLEERKQALEELKAERDYDLRLRELDLKKADSSWIARFFTPTSTTILAGIFALAGSAVGAYWQSQSALELERKKEQHELILKMVTGVEDKQARANLKFLADTGLIDASLGASVQEALKRDTVPFVPSATAPSSSRAFQAVRTDDDAVDLVLAWERGFVQDPVNPARSTNDGITLAALSTYLGREATLDELKSMPPAMVKDYYRRYLAPAAGITVPTVRAAFLNLAVMSGTLRAVTTFQKAAQQVLDRTVFADGVLGPQSVALINSVQDPDRLIETVSCLTIADLKRSSGWSLFGPGLVKRMRAFSPVALQGVCADLAQVPIEQPLPTGSTDSTTR